jgi:hypothetical protein
VETEEVKFPDRRNDGFPDLQRDHLANAGVAVLTDEKREF